MKKNTKQIGNVTEAMVLAALVRNFDAVLQPFGDNSRYDLVVEHAGVFLRVQCKTARTLNGGVQFPTASSQAHRGRGRQTYVGQADYFGVAHHETGQVFLVPVLDDGNVNSMTLRTKPFKGANHTQGNWALDYDIDVQAAKIRSRIEATDCSTTA